MVQLFCGWKKSIKVRGLTLFWCIWGIVWIIENWLELHIEPLFLIMSSFFPRCGMQGVDPWFRSCLLTSQCWTSARLRWIRAVTWPRSLRRCSKSTSGNKERLWKTHTTSIEHVWVAQLLHCINGIHLKQLLIRLQRSLCWVCFAVEGLERYHTVALLSTNW